MAKNRSRTESRQMRHRRIRRVVIGSPERPRICVFRSNKHLYAQIIDDQSGRCLGTVSTLSKEVRSQNLKGGAEQAKAVGSALAEKAKALKVERAVFDRGGYRYHGVVKALADAIREGGLAF